MLDRNTPLLFTHVERRYAYFLAAEPMIEECLLIPFYVDGKAVGTIWAIAHDDLRKFDAEDLRQLTSLGRFASAAFQTVEAIDAALLQRRAAFTLMEESVRARDGMDSSNAALLLSEERYRTLFESIDEGFCIIEKVPGETGEPLDFRYIEANPAFAVQSGVSNVVGKTIRQVFPGEREESFITYDSILSTGEPTRFEAQLPTDGRVFEVYAFRVANGPPHRVAIRFNNVTKRRKAEDALRESEAFNRSIVESSSDCIKVLDLDGHLLSMPSGQDLLGIDDIVPFLNTSWIDFWEGEHRISAKAAVDLAVEGGTGGFVGFFRTLRDEPKWWDVCISPILDANGKPVRLLAVSRDVTQRKQFESDLRQRSVQFETLLNEAPLGVFLVDADFRIRQINPSALLAFGDIPDLVGRDFDEVPLL